MTCKYPRSVWICRARASPPVLACSKTRCSSRRSAATTSSSVTRRCSSTGMPNYVVQRLQARFPLHECTVGIPLGWRSKRTATICARVAVVQVEEDFGDRRSGGYARILLFLLGFVTAEELVRRSDNGDLGGAARGVSRARLEGQAARGRGISIRKVAWSDAYPRNRRRPSSSPVISCRSCSVMMHQVVGIDNFLKYGPHQRADQHPAYTFVRGRDTALMKRLIRG